jgi:lipopolysaccharide biosynthesis glycosyltransferase
LITNLVIAADRNYLYPALVLLANLNEKGLWFDEKVKLWFLSSKGELSDDDKVLIEATIGSLGGQIRFEFAELDLSEMPDTWGYLSKTTLVRLLLPEFLGDVEWIWVDVDAVLRTSWAEVKLAFFPSNRKEGLVAAKCHEYDAIKQQLSGNPVESYFNAGVVSWKPQSRDDNLGAKYLSALGEFSLKGLPGDDQDVMNSVHAGKVHIISGDYNAFGGYLFQHPERDEIKISHFAGATKPWHLPLSAQQLCLEEVACPWQPFFESDKFLFSRISHSAPDQLENLRSVRVRANLSGNPDWKVVWFARIVSKLPGLIRNRFFPRGLWERNYAHPLHSRS